MGYLRTYTEARLGDGTLVHLEVLEPQKDQVQKALALVHRMWLPESHKVNVPHGGHGKYSRYNLVQHNYAGGPSGFREVLEVKDAPDGRCSYLVYSYRTNGQSEFWEFASVEAAQKSWMTNRLTEPDTLTECPGFQRRVLCNLLTPWFYAVGQEELVGDYVLPEHLCDDPVYRLGQRFVIQDPDKTIRVKTCLGCRWYEEKLYGKDKPLRFRVVIFDDGTCWDESRSMSHQPRPLESSEEWIEEVLRQFRQMLDGGQVSMAINLIGGYCFEGRIAKTTTNHAAAGKYWAVVTYRDGEVDSGTFDFKPSKAYPTPIVKIAGSLGKKHGGIARIQIKVVPPSTTTEEDEEEVDFDSDTGLATFYAHSHGKKSLIE